MSLVAGSYERFIWGFTLKPQSLTLTPLFSYPSHLSLIKTVAISGSVVASGGTDDTIHLYNLSAASSLGSLHTHSATVTALSFYTPPNLAFPRNLISADADGALCIFDADGFVHLKTVPSVHRKGVNDLALHPSGKLALTVGHDECLAMVNLVRGRRSFCCRLGKEASLVKFDSSGDKFFMAMEEKVSVHEAEDARLLVELECPKRVLCTAPAKNGLLYTGDSDGATGGDDPFLVASASSDGVIRVWDVRMAATEKPNPLAECKTQSRLTCLAGSSLKLRPQAGKSNPKGEDQTMDG